MGGCSITSLNIVGTHCAGVIPAIIILDEWSFGRQDGGLRMLFWTRLEGASVHLIMTVKKKMGDKLRI